jgi:DNA-binding transcriptional LysR family regulator
VERGGLERSRGGNGMMATGTDPELGTTRRLSRTTKCADLIWEPSCGSHQGQRPRVPRQQAGHMTAPDRCVTSKFTLAVRGPFSNRASAFGGMRQPLTLRDCVGRRHDLIMTCRIRTTAPTQQREWALAGLGITRLPRFLVADDLASGRLVHVLPDHRYDGPSLFAVYARENAGAARLRALLAHVQHAARAAPLTSS